MNSNFQLITHKQNQKLVINLSGIFDGASAWGLINAIINEHDKAESIHIDTTRLTQIFMFGKIILEGNLPHHLKRDKLLFLGENADEIMPKGCKLFHSQSSKTHQCKGNCKNCTCRKTSQLKNKEKNV